MAYKKFDDNFNSIIKSLKPIKNKFSRQSLSHDKYFKKSSIESIEKNLNGQKISPENYYTSKLYKNIDYMYNVSNDCYDYIEDLKGSKNIPIKINQKGYNFIKNLYNPEFEVRPEDRYYYDDNIRSYNYDAKRFNRSNKIFKFKIYALDPGYYHPNYNFVKKRMPSVDFSKSLNNHEKYEIAKISEDNNENYLKPEYKENINQKNSIEEDKETNIINKENEENDKKGIKYMSRNYPKIKYSGTPKNILPNNIKEEVKRNKINSLPKIQKCKSQINISTPIMISFNKMSGRNKNKKIRNFVEKTDIEYKPNYSSTLPHVRNIKFKSNVNKENNKKYIVVKILRSYCFNSYGYFVMDIKKNKNKKKDDFKFFINNQNK